MFRPVYASAMPIVPANERPVTHVAGRADFLLNDDDPVVADAVEDGDDDGEG